MASITLDTGDAFADGATVGAYPASAWSGLPPSGSPPVAATASATITNKQAAFSGLTAGVSYYLSDASGSRYVLFTVPATGLSTTSVAALAAGTQAAIDAQGLAVANEAVARALADAALDADDGLPGYLAPSFRGCSTGTLTLVANRSYFARFCPTRAATVTAINFMVTTAASANDNVDVGIYNATTLARVASSGATASKLNATGPQSVALSASLTAGQPYFAAIACGTLGGTAAIVVSGTVTTANAARLFGNTPVDAYTSCHVDSQHPLPSTSGAVTVNASVPFLAVVC